VENSGLQLAVDQCDELFCVLVLEVERRDLAVRIVLDSRRLAAVFGVNVERVENALAHRRGGGAGLLGGGPLGLGAGGVGVPAAILGMARVSGNSDHESLLPNLELRTRAEIHLIDAYPHPIL